MSVISLYSLDSTIPSCVVIFVFGLLVIIILIDNQRLRFITEASMILAVLTFGFALGQVLLDQEIVSSEKKFIVAIVVAILSGIPLSVQFIVLSGELARAQKHSIKLLLHRMMMSIAGDYGPASNLLIKQYRQKKIGEYTTAHGLWRCSLYLGHCLAKFFGLFLFGDAFSGVFTVRYTSVALWMEGENQAWKGCEKPRIDENLFSDPDKKFKLEKDVRDLSLTVEFSAAYCTDLEKRQSTMVHCHVFATGSRDDPISKLYYESVWKEDCRVENARELCTLMEALNNDSFILKCRPPMTNDVILIDQIFSCEEELSVIVQSILRDNKKLIGRRVQGISYV